MSEEDSKESLTDLVSEISSLREELASQQTEIKSLRAKVKLLEAEPSRSAQSQTLGSQLATATTSRRNLLKLGGAAAGLAVLSGLSMAANQPHVILAGDDDKPPAPPIPPPTKSGSRPPSTNATGDPLQLGFLYQGSTGQAATGIWNSNGSILNPVVFRANNFTNTNLALPTSTKVALAGTSSGSTDDVASTRVGIYGAADTNGYGVWGHHASGGVGVYATANGNNSDGIRSSVTGSNAWGVNASSADSYGGHFYGGLAAMYLSISGADPRTRTDTHSVGELYRDSSGNLWYCIASGIPGTWRKLAGSGTTGSLQLFSTPARFINTLNGTGVPGVSAGPYVGTKVFTIGGQTIGGNTVPSGASGILAVAAAYSAGFLSAVPFAQSGILTVFGSTTGSPVPSVNSVSFSAGQLLNSSQVTSSLASNKLAIFTYANGQPVHVVLDILGYYL